MLKHCRRNNGNPEKDLRLGLSSLSSLSENGPLCVTFAYSASRQWNAARKSVTAETQSTRRRRRVFFLKTLQVQEQTIIMLPEGGSLGLELVDAVGLSA